MCFINDVIIKFDPRPPSILNTASSLPLARCTSVCLQPPLCSGPDRDPKLEWWKSELESLLAGN